MMSLGNWQALLSDVPPEQILNRVQSEQRRRNYAAFCRYVAGHLNLEYAHTKFVIETVQAWTVNGHKQNLMVSMPPQHGKTTFATILQIAWQLLRNPKLRVAIISYNQTMANRISYECRMAAEYGGVQLDTQRRAVEEWRTAAGGMVRAVGVGGGLTGYPVDLAVIDDPFKDREEAESPVIRDRVWQHYTDVITTRNPRAQLLIGTEWHEDGLHARIRQHSNPARWQRINLPAIAVDGDVLGRSPGEPLCSEIVTLEELEYRRELNPHSFEAMYQGNPTPREGSFFKALQLGYTDQVPENLPTIRAWDFGASLTGDYTCGVKLAGPDSNGKFYVLDVVRGRYATDEMTAVLRSTAEADGSGVKIRFPRDPGTGSRHYEQMLARVMSGFYFTFERESKSKEHRAGPVSAQVGMGNVCTMRAGWTAAFVEELRAFPLGKYDDQVDAFSAAYNSLAGGGEFSVELV